MTGFSARKSLPLFLLCLLLLAAGVGVYRKAQQAVAPPMYDAIEYYMKAANTWASLRTGHPTNPMEAVPAFRPPGTALFLYPFGFEPEFHGMLFRVTFLPLAMFLVAFWMVANPLATDVRGRWLNFGAAAALGALPLFHQMEFNEQFHSPAWWGLMDAPVASLCALALAFLLASVRNRRIGMALCGGALAAFTLLVKPVGLFLIPLILWHWAVEVGVACWPLRLAWRGEPRFRRYVVVTSVALTIMIGAVVTTALRSSYFSAENMQFASTAMKLVRSKQLGSIIQGFSGEIHYTVGVYGLLFFAAFAGGIVIRVIRRAFRRALTANDVRYCAALFAFFGGVVWWFLLPGTLCRYMFPFILVFLIAVTPRLVAGMRRLPAMLQTATTGAGTAWFSITMILLFMNHPPVRFQQWLGLNFSSGGFRGETALAAFLCQDASRAGRPIQVYSTGNGCVPGVVQAAVIQRFYQYPGERGVTLEMPMDWTTGPVYKRERVTAADYLMYHPARDPLRVQNRFATIPVTNFEMERALFESWLTVAGAAEGLEQVPVDGGSLKLARIVDRRKFETAYGDFVGQHHWRPIFLEANRPKQQLGMSGRH